METEHWPDAGLTPLVPGSLRQGILWNAVGQVTARVLSLLFLGILARLVAPRDFGLIAVGGVFISFASTITDIGVGAALVQKQRDVRQNASAAFYMNAMMMLLLAVALLLLSEPIARYYGQPTLNRLLPLLTASFLVRSSMAVHEAYLRKRMLFRRLQLINIASIVAYGALALPLAATGAGAWSLAWGLLAGSSVYAGALLVGSGMPLSVNPHLRHWHGLFVFGRWVFLGGVATWLLGTGDNLAVGKFLGPSDLGAYTMAFNYGQVPFFLVGGSIAQATFPAYSRLQNDRRRLQSLLMKVIRVSAVVSLPIAGTLLFVASDLLVATLGPNWTQAGPPFRVFAVVFTSLMFVASFPRVIDALGRPVIYLYICIATLPAMVVGIAVGLRFGVMGVALGISMMQIIFASLQVFAVSKIARISVRTIMNGVWPPTLCVVSGIAAGMLPFVLLREVLPRLPTDAIASLVMLGVYLLALRRFFPSRWSEVLLHGRAVFAARSGA